MTQAAMVFAARFVLVTLGYLSLESCLDRKPAVTALRAGFCALIGIWIDRQVLVESSLPSLDCNPDAAAAGSVAGIVAANYLMTRRRKNRGQE